MPVINSLSALNSLEHPERFTELHAEEEREEGTRGNEEKRESQKGERPIQPEICSLSVLHSLEHPERFTELSREEKREAIEVTWERKGRVKRGEISQASNHTPK